MAKKEKSSNRFFPYLELTGDQIKMAEEVSPGFGHTLNDRFRQLAELIESTTGLRGQIGVDDSISLKGENRASGLADPTNDQDGVTFRMLKEMTTCSKLTQILDGCNDHEDAVNSLVEDEVTATSIVPGMWSPTVFTPRNVATAVWTADRAYARQFVLPYNALFTTATYNVTSGAAAGRYVNFGIYDSNLDLVWQLGATETTTNGVKTATFTLVSLDPGVYYHVFTATFGITLMAHASANVGAILNAKANRTGRLSDTASAVLPSTLGSIDTTQLSALPILYFRDMS